MGVMRDCSRKSASCWWGVVLLVLAPLSSESAESAAAGALVRSRSAFPKWSLARAVLVAMQVLEAGMGDWRNTFRSSFWRGPGG
jgi:flavin-binding protein dodecin